MKIAIIILAAGRGSRMERPHSHKLLALLDGEPIVKRVASQAIASRASSVTVVTGFRHAEIDAALVGLHLCRVHNPDYVEGMGRSLATGLCAPEALNADAALVMLADMPWITSAHLDMLITAFRDCAGHAVIRASSAGTPGHPVILPRSLYGASCDLQGDVGARHMIESSGLPVTLVEIGEAAIQDVDTPQDLITVGGVFPT